MVIKSILLTKSRTSSGRCWIRHALFGSTGGKQGHPPTEWLQNHTRRSRPLRSGLMRSPSGKGLGMIKVFGNEMFHTTLLYVKARLSGIKSGHQSRRHKRCRFEPWVGKIPWGSKRQPTPLFLPGKFHGQRSLVGHSLWSQKVGHDWARTHAKAYQLVHLWYYIWGL